MLIVLQIQKQNCVKPTWHSQWSACLVTCYETDAHSTLDLNLTNSRTQVCGSTQLQCHASHEEVNLRNPLLEVMKHASEGYPPWLWNPRQTSLEVQNKDIHGPIKWLMSSKIKTIITTTKPWSLLNINGFVFHCYLKHICVRDDKAYKVDINPAFET